MTPDPDLRDSLALESARTPEQFSRIVADIEARHAVEGISNIDHEAWEAVKRRHAERIAAVVAA